MLKLLVAATLPVAAGAAAAGAGFSWGDVMVSIVGTSPLAGLAVLAWQSERKERREWTKDFVELAKANASTNEKIADRLDRIERKVGAD